MSLAPEPAHVTHIVLVWLGIAQRLHDRHDDALAGTISAAMDRRLNVHCYKGRLSGETMDGDRIDLSAAYRLEHHTERGTPWCHPGAGGGGGVVAQELGELARAGVA